jgi:hypothetical protein
VLEVGAALEEVVGCSGYIAERDVESVESRCKWCKTCEECVGVELAGGNEERSDG